MYVPNYYSAKCQLCVLFGATQAQQQQEPKQRQRLSATPATIKNGQVLKLGYTQKKRGENKITFL